MPELPDVTVYVERLDAKLRGAMLHRVRVLNPFVLRTAVPNIAEAEGRHVLGIERLGRNPAPCALVAGDADTLARKRAGRDTSTTSKRCYESRLATNGRTTFSRRST